ncbi:hypothetical protein [Aurantibacter sp.]|uniref:hypothetical protein n=1 Tax=Aurantibacter sp. TaxID=2807103 RepID=UPI0035C83AAA
MKYFILISLITITILSCQKNDELALQNNPFIPNFTFDTQTLINTDLPQYNDLQFPGNHIILNNNYGLNGVVVYYAGGTNYSAFELTDPSHVVSNCSKLTVEGVIATCGCDDFNEFEILSGQPYNGTSSQYTLKHYFVEVNGSVIRVYNN